MGLFSKLKDKLAQVQQENRENPKEKTAPTEIFDRMRQKIEEAQKKAAKKKGRTRKKSKGGSIFSQLKDKLAEAQRENQASPKEETADSSILDKVQAELEKLEKKKKPIEIETKKAEAPAWGSPTGTGMPSVDDILGRVAESAKKEQAKKKSTPKKEEDFGSIFDQIMGSNKPKTSKKTKPKKEEDFGTIFDQVVGASKSTSSKSSKTKKSSSKASAPVSDFGDIFDKIVTPGSSRAASTSSGDGGKDGLYVGGSGFVDGKGGSLSMRVEPSMGAGTLRKRLPDNVNVSILDHTNQNAISIDGQTAGWYKVDYNGQQGWILDIYLE